MPVFLERFILPVFAAIIAAIWLTNPMSFDTTQKVTLSLALVFLALFVAQTVHRHNQAAKTPSTSTPTPTAELAPTQSATPTPTPKQPKRPSITARLIIDTAGRKEITHRLQLENIGKVAVSNVRVSSNTKDFLGLEMVPAASRMLPPGGRIAVSGAYGAIQPKKHTKLVAEVLYEARVGEENIAFLSRFSFFIAPKDLKPQIIDPDGWEVHELGEATILRQQDEAVARLSLPQAELFMAIPEIGPDGEPNVAKFGDPSKQFIFDPVSRIVTFKFKTLSEREVSLELPLQRTNNGIHPIMVFWDDAKGAGLSVDNVTKEDMEG